MKIKWLGDEDHSETTVGDLVFPAGKVIEVPDNHPKAAKLKAHPSFEVQGSSEDGDDPSEDGEQAED
jgi:hypothetical protein